MAWDYSTGWQRSTIYFCSFISNEMSHQESVVSSISSTTKNLNKLLVSLTDGAGNIKLSDFGDLSMAPTSEEGAGWKAIEMIRDQKANLNSDIQVCHQIHSFIARF